MNDGLIVLNHNCIFVPVAWRKQILHLLHAPHCGITKTMAMAWNHYFWPTLKNDMMNLINSCEDCQQFQPSLKNDTEINTIASQPMEKVSVDLFKIAGKHYVLTIDQFSGYPWMKRLQCLSSNHVTKYLLSIFQTFGYPRAIQTDGGPQFWGEFGNFCCDLGIIHEWSSPSNGQAEVTIRSIKHLMAKCNASNFDSAFAPWKNTHHSNSPLPNNLFFNRNLLLHLPIVDTAQPLTPNRTRPEDVLRPINASSKIWVQDPSGLWRWKGIVKSINPLWRTYIVELEDGRIFQWNRKFIRPRYN